MTLELTKSDNQIETIDDDLDFDDEFEGHEDGRVSLLGRIFSVRNTFYMFVLIPALLAAVYYTFLVSEQYVTESRMIVRTIGVSDRFDKSEEREGRSVIGGDSLTQDSYIVANYLESPELVETLEREIGLRKMFAKPEIDFLSRLPEDASFEKLHSYWGRHIDTYVDGPSGIIVFTVRAFTPEDSVQLLNAALGHADKMIEKLSERAKDDLVRRAENDVRASLELYHAALDELRNYQNQTGILDPVSKAKLTSEVIAKLVEEKLALTVELDSLKASNITDTARTRQLSRAIAALDDQIRLREDSLAGSKTGDVALSENLVAFSRLETRRVVTEAIYEATVRNLDTAKATAIRRTTFISAFSAPFMPEDSEYPKRFSSWAIFALGMFTLWVCGTLIWASIQDHRA